MPGLGRVETLGEVGLAASQVRVSVRPEADTGSSFRNRPFDATPMGSGHGQ